jgi:hypothetical protein
MNLPVYFVVAKGVVCESYRQKLRRFLKKPRKQAICAAFRFTSFAPFRMIVSTRERRYAFAAL